MLVERGKCPKNLDQLLVFDEHGNQVVSASMGPGGLLHPRSAAEARSRPWFFTGSPFGPWIYGLAWERHAARQRIG